MATRTKNVGVHECALSRAKDVDEGETSLVWVSGSERRSRDRVAVSTVREPEDEGRVEQSDERRGPQNGLLGSGLRVGEAEALLGIAKEDLDPPTACIGLENCFGAVGRER